MKFFHVCGNALWSNTCDFKGVQGHPIGVDRSHLRMSCWHTNGGTPVWHRPRGGVADGVAVGVLGRRRRWRCGWGRWWSLLLQVVGVGRGVLVWLRGRRGRGVPLLGVADGVGAHTQWKPCGRGTGWVGDGWGLVFPRGKVFVKCGGLW